MTSIVQNMSDAIVASVVVAVPDYNANRYSETFAIERLPTEPVGSTVLTLTNVPAGARYRIERQGDGSLATPTANATDVSVSGGTVPITLDQYSAGSANNDLRIKVRCSSSGPFYKAQESLLTITAAGASVFIPQVLDQ